MARIDNTIYVSNSAMYSGAGTQYMVKANNGYLYVIWIDGASDVVFKRSTDGGYTWGAPTSVYAGTVTALSVWYDRWSGLSTDYISIAWQESGTDDTLFRTINTGSSDALSTQTSIFAGTSTASGGYLSIARTRGGNVVCDTVIDAGAEGGFFKLLNADFPNGAWSAALTSPEALATQDQIILLPGWAADNNDVMAFFWDASANEVSRYLYDDSAGTWGETSIATSMNDLVATTGWPCFAATVDTTNSRNLLVAWSGADTVNADLRCWHVTESAITEVTNVVLNSTDDQALCAITIDTTTEDWYVFYGGKSDGSEVWTSAIKLYYKKSTDDGATWGAETLLTSTSAMNIRFLATIPRVDTDDVLKVLFQDALSTQEIKINLALPSGGGSFGYGFCG